MTQTYWEVGRMIVEEEQGGKDHAAYGKQILKFLSERLTVDFGEGFDSRNLRYMRSFYQHFPIWNAVRSELSWTDTNTKEKEQIKQLLKLFVCE